MRTVGVCTGPLVGLMNEVSDWLVVGGYASATSARAKACVRRFSAWMAVRGVGVDDLSHDLLDEFIVAERDRLDGGVPSAVQHLGVFRRFLVERGTLIVRPAASRDRDGLPRLQVGPLAGLLPDLASWLKQAGYARGTRVSVACTAARLSAWMQQARVTDLSEEVLARFVTAQLHGRPRHASSAKRIVTVAKYLVARGHLQVVPPVPAPDSPVGAELGAWGAWQHTECDVGDLTISERRRFAHDLLAGLAGGDGRVDWSRLDCDLVNRYVAERGHGYSLSSRRHLVDAMRSLTRWAFLTGRCARPLGGGILRLRVSRATLPRALEVGQVAAILAAADPATVQGVRDKAVIVAIARLGLRAGEVAGLTLDDIDWATAQLSVTGKGGRRRTLPLPADVGEAIVDYLRERPPGAVDRAVFVRSRPPLQGLGRQGISGIVAHRAAQAGLGVVHAHRLRHTVATGVLAAGGTLTEARELLGHTHSDTTMIYAKTDLAALRALAVPFGQVPR